MHEAIADGLHAILMTLHAIDAAFDSACHEILVNCLSVSFAGMVDIFPR